MFKVYWIVDGVWFCGLVENRMRVKGKCFYGLRRKWKWVDGKWVKLGVLFGMVVKGEMCWRKVDGKWFKVKV